MKKFNSGMSLVEVVIAMAIIGIVSLIAYRGISTGVGMMARGSRLSVSITQACKTIEQNISLQNDATPGSINVQISCDGSTQSRAINSLGYRSTFEYFNKDVYIYFFDSVPIVEEEEATEEQN